MLDNANAKIKVLLIDDDTLNLEGLTSWANKYDDIVVVGQATRNDYVISLVQEHAPDVVVLDIQMPDSEYTAVEVLTQLQAHKKRAEVGEGQHVEVVMISAWWEYELINTYRDKGAIGFLHKKDVRRDFVGALRAAAEGRAYYGRNMYEHINRSDPFACLTNHQREILGHLVSGYTNKEINNKYGTVKNVAYQNLRKIREQLEVYNGILLANRERLMAYALLNGFQPLDPPPGTPQYNRSRKR